MPRRPVCRGVGRARSRILEFNSSRSSTLSVTSRPRRVGFRATSSLEPAYLLILVRLAESLEKLYSCAFSPSAVGNLAFIRSCPAACPRSLSDSTRSAVTLGSFHAAFTRCRHSGFPFPCFVLHNSLSSELPVLLPTVTANFKKVYVRRRAVKKN